ncbi:MAG: Rpn family recombination-promoting nuclease/putative transposase [Magnetococcales bacterium]|nr:Rpn family recombination-promoting nuclease/putative transposase [Magnetococcales bacterium]
MPDYSADSDAIYHQLFSHPEMVADLLTGFLDATLLTDLDLPRMKRLNTKFTAARGKRRRGDMVWEIPTHSGGPLFILLILEFQSTIDPWMPLRILVYSGLLYQQLVDERKLTAEQGLPPVLPVVLFNGQPRWHAATRLHEVIQLPKDSPLWQYQPEMRYHVIDEGRYAEEELQGLGSLSALLFHLEHPARPEAVLETGRLLAQWFKNHPEGVVLKGLFRELLLGAMERTDGFNPLPTVPEELQEVVNMLAYHIEKWKKEAALEGELRGDIRGEQKGKADLLLRLLRRRFGDVPEWAITRVASAEVSTLEAWSERIFDTPSLETLLQPVPAHDGALQE